MNRLQLEVSRALWRRRYSFRLRRWHYYHDQRGQNNTTRRLRAKWWKLLIEAQREASHRDVQLAALPKPKVSSRQRCLEWERSKVGIHEQPNGSNRGPQIDEWQRRFGFLGVAWCGIFAGNGLVHAGVKGVTSRIASVSAIEADAANHRGCFWGFTRRSAHGAVPGDLVCLFSPGEHVETIRKVNGDGSVDTYGGNFSNSVVEGHRAASSIVGVAHVRFP